MLTLIIMLLVKSGWLGSDDLLLLLGIVGVFGFVVLSIGHFEVFSAKPYLWINNKEGKTEEQILWEVEEKDLFKKQYDLFEELELFSNRAYMASEYGVHLKRRWILLSAGFGCICFAVFTLIATLPHDPEAAPAVKRQKNGAFQKGATQRP